jgi:hypothetical protein
LEGVENGIDMRGKAGVEGHCVTSMYREGAALAEAGGDLKAGGRASGGETIEGRPRPAARLQWQPATPPGVACERGP